MKSSNIPKHLFKYSSKKLKGFDINTLEKVEELRGDTLFYPHRMDFHILIYIKRGCGIIYIDFKENHLSDNIIIPVAFGQIIQYDKNIFLEGHVIKFNPSFIVREKINLSYLYGLTIFNPLISPQIIEANTELHQIIASTINAFSKDIASYQFEELLRSYLKVLLITLETQKREFTPEKFEDEIVENNRFYELVDENINYRLKVIDVANALQITPKKLNLLLKKHTGRTAKKFIDDRLILETKRLLAHSRMTVKEIAFHLQFDEVANMSNFFKRCTSMTPLEFRTNMESRFLQ